MPKIVPDVVAKGTMAATVQPRLGAGETLLLRAWEPGDIPAVVDAYADPIIQRWHLETKDQAEAADWIERGNAIWQDETGASWAITDAASGAVLGRIGLRDLHLDEGRAELAYWVLPAARGRGAATEAVVAITRWALDDLALHRLVLLHSTQNSASCRVATKTGFELEGVMRQFLLHGDGWHDMHLHGRFRS